MAKLSIKAGSTDVSVLVMVLDSTSTTGGRKQLAYNESGLTCYYTRVGESATAVTLYSQTVTGAHTDGGFVAIGTNQPGLHRLDLPDAVFAAGARSVVVTLKGAANMVQVDLEFDLMSEVDAVALSGDATAADYLELVAEGTRGVMLQTTQSEYAPAKAGDAMTLTTGERTTLTSTIWDALLTGITTVGSIGKLIKDYLDAAISSRSTYAGGDTAGTSTLLGRIIGTLAAGTHNPQSGDAFSRLGAPAGASVSADIAAVKAETADIDAEVDYIHSVVDSIAVTGSALTKEASSATLTVGTQTSGTYASTAIDNGVYHVITASANQIDIYYQFDIGASGIPSRANIAGYLKETAPAGGDTIDLYAYNWAGATWELLHTAVFTGIITDGPDTSHAIALLNRHVGTGANDGLVRIRFQAASLESGATLNLDYLTVDYAESVTGDLAAIKADSAAILLDTGTDGVKIATAEQTALIEALLAYTIVGGPFDGTSVLDMLKAAWVQGAGDWAIDTGALTLELKAPDGTSHIVFSLDSVTAPTTRTKGS